MRVWLPSRERALGLQSSLVSVEAPGHTVDVRGPSSLVLVRSIVPVPDISAPAYKKLLHHSSPPPFARFARGTVLWGTPERTGRPPDPEFLNFQVAIPVQLVLTPS